MNSFRSLIQYFGTKEVNKIIIKYRKFDFEVKSKHFFNELNCEKVLNILYSIGKKTFKTFGQLLFFVGHPVADFLILTLFVHCPG